MIRRTRGFLLLPVALTLVVVGALAYTMTRDAGMNVTSVDAEYDTDVARYLAEAAVNLARWKNNQQKCNDIATFNPTPLYRYSLANNKVGTTAADLVGTMTLNGITVVGNNSTNNKNSITVDVSSATTTTPAASQRIVRTVYRYDLSNKRTTTITGGTSTTISTANPAPGTPGYMELTDSGPGNQSYGLLQFNVDAFKNALVKTAKLRLKLTDTDIFPLFGRQLDIYRVASTWNAATAVWAFPWAKPGGDYAADQVIRSAVGIGILTIYEWPIDALASGWIDGTVPNNGLLLKPTNLSRTRFAAFGADTGGPQLALEYYERCK